MPLLVHTAQIRYAFARKPDALDVTRAGVARARKAGDPCPPGEFLAPSWDLLMGFKEGRLTTEEQYTELYLAEMRSSYVEQRGRWAWLLGLPRIVLCCYEPWPEFCHRHILRTRILPALGAVDGGEIS